MGSGVGSGWVIFEWGGVGLFFDVLTWWLGYSLTRIAVRANIYDSPLASEERSGVVRRTGGQELQQS